MIGAVFVVAYGAWASWRVVVAERARVAAARVPRTVTFLPAFIYPLPTPTKATNNG